MSALSERSDPRVRHIDMGSLPRTRHLRCWMQWWRVYSHGVLHRLQIGDNNPRAEAILEASENGCHLPLLGDP